MKIEVNKIMNPAFLLGTAFGNRNNYWKSWLSSVNTHLVPGKNQESSNRPGTAHQRLNRRSQGCYLQEPNVNDVAA